MILDYDDMYLLGQPDDDDGTWTFNWGLEGGVTITDETDIVKALDVMETKYGYYLAAIKEAKAQHLQDRKPMVTGAELNLAEIEQRIADLKASLEGLN